MYMLTHHSNIHPVASVQVLPAQLMNKAGADGSTKARVQWSAHKVPGGPELTVAAVALLAALCAVGPKSVPCAWYGKAVNT